jgi:hypothetical protein
MKTARLMIVRIVLAFAQSVFGQTETFDVATFTTEIAGFW